MQKSPSKNESRVGTIPQIIPLDADGRFTQPFTKKPAIQELKKALEKGMTNAKALDDAAFDRIREEQGFKEIVTSLSQSQPK